MREREDGTKLHTYTTQQLEQFQQAHNDALMMCRKVIEASTGQTDTFDRLFTEYFSSIDRQLVLGQSALQRCLASDHSLIHGKIQCRQLRYIRHGADMDDVVWTRFCTSSSSDQGA
jgi:hypothetical protein